MSSFTLRDAVPADAAALSTLASRTFVTTFGHLYDPADLGAFLLGYSEENWLRELEDPTLRIRLAEADEGAVGYAKFGPVKLPVEPSGPAAELRALYVLQSWHGTGLAQQLMDWTLEQARNVGARELYLSVYFENHRARRFYERYGFRFVAPYAFMVGSQADEDHILRLDLGGTA